MMRPSGQRRAGVTLIELLVVIAIIAVLTAILVPAVMKVADAGPRAENRARLLAVNSAIGNFKADASFGKQNYIPAGAYDLKTGAQGPFRLRNAYPTSPTGSEPGLYSFEAQYIVAVFGIQILDPSQGITDLGFPGLRADLDANQTLTFFLTGMPVPDGQGNAVFTGFSPSQKPFTPRSPTNATEPRRGPILDLGGGGNRPKYALTPIGNLSYASLLDPYGTPYAYFCAFNGQANRYYGANGGVAAPVLPYGTGTGPGKRYENPSGYQLISAGKDTKFGTTGDTKNIDGPGQDDLSNIFEKQMSTAQ